MKTIIIAEAGVNHNGSFDIAKKLVLEAANAGADYVKFQTFKADKLVSKVAEKAFYQKNNTPSEGNTQYEMLRKLEMPEEWHYKLIEYSKSLGIKFLSTGFDEASIDFLDQLNVDLFKIPSGEITNLPYLEHVARKRKSVVISTGMSYLEEVKEAVQVLLLNGVTKDQITILHCNTEYPTPMIDVNLRAMNTLKDELGLNIGYSDHTLGIEVPIAAVALGAKIIEKHFTIDRNMSGPDHKASLNPNELKEMINSIRNTELALSGSGLKIPSKSESKNISIARKSIHLNKSIKKGEIIKREDLVMKRPGDGISPMNLYGCINKTALIDLEEGRKLSEKDYN